MPDLQTILEHSKGDSYEEYLVYISWHQAISSEAYLLHSTNDPLEAAITAGKAIQKSRSMQPHHLRAGFDILFFFFLISYFTWVFIQVLSPVLP